MNVKFFFLFQNTHHWIKCTLSILSSKIFIPGDRGLIYSVQYWTRSCSIHLKMERKQWTFLSNQKRETDARKISKSTSQKRFLDRHHLSPLKCLRVYLNVIVKEHTLFCWIFFFLFTSLTATHSKKCEVSLTPQAWLGPSH